MDRYILGAARFRFIGRIPLFQLELAH
jgi:hypothetical protein